VELIKLIRPSGNVARHTLPSCHAPTEHDAAASRFRIDGSGDDR
jgi:hypothetical protein